MGKTEDEGPAKPDDPLLEKNVFFIDASRLPAGLRANWKKWAQKWKQTTRLVRLALDSRSRLATRGDEASSEDAEGGHHYADL